MKTEQAHKPTSHPPTPATLMEETNPKQHIEKTDDTTPKTHRKVRARPKEPLHAKHTGTKSKEGSKSDTIVMEQTAEAGRQRTAYILQMKSNEDAMLS